MSTDPAAPWRIELNGTPATAAALRQAALLNYGHFSSMQVRNGAIRGLDLHLARLDHASQLLFGRPLPAARVRAALRTILGGGPAALSLRITVLPRGFSLAQPDGEFEPDLLLSTAPPGATAAPALRLCSSVYRRESPQIKHVGTFGLLLQLRLARQRGCDDVVFVDGHGEIAEASVWNIGFHDGRQFVFPAAPALPGVTLALLQHGLTQAGLDFATRSVRLDQLAGFRAAFLCNARVPVQPVASIDGHGFDDPADLWQLLRDCHDRQPAEPP